ncbi:MAG TPA: hypothetical protein PLH80_03660 [Spirochaetota bacterium]|nr:hypothetical protein [Spirochaetota bacterium]HOR93411.1 hypothetical protein [Spirochaetota bacterium]HOT19153.1 hypothetical protein [Spirochaetota bacterium]HPD03908.1 hypothetical protein [Spirochaetota bacterium]HPK43446.1 hypothetical protein [Spirochaetota bacterium]
MVQVDIVWSYAFGASFAAVAAHQLKIVKHFYKLWNCIFTFAIFKKVLHIYHDYFL